MRDTVADGWEAFAKDVKPAEAERERLREAFYAGAYAGHILTLSACIVADDASCEAELAALSEELQPKERS